MPLIWRPSWTCALVRPCLRTAVSARSSSWSFGKGKKKRRRNFFRLYQSQSAAPWRAPRSGCVPHGSKMLSDFRSMPSPNLNGKRTTPPDVERHETLEQSTISSSTRGFSATEAVPRHFNFGNCKCHLKPSAKQVQASTNATIFASVTLFSRSYRFHIAQRHALAGAICNGRGHGEDWQRGQVTLAWSFLPPSPINFPLEEHLASCQRHRNRLAI